jgi:hypothetical protein
MSRILYFLIVILPLMACSKRNAPISLLRPADVTMPSEINSMVTIDRSKPSGGFWNVVEGLLTGEAIGQDREGRRRSIESLRMVLIRTPRFKVIHSGIELEGSRSGARFPDPLPWAVVDEYCRRYKADVLVSLELFDSDTPMSVTSEKKKDKEGKEYREFIVNQQVIIRTGWRIYDPVQRVILDEHVSSANRFFSNRGLDSAAVVRARRWQMEDVRNIARLSGEAYAARIAPIWIQESRTFYAKGAKADRMNFRLANEWIKLGKWEATIPIYHNLIEQTIDPKTAGRAAFNLALAYEQTDNIEEAIRWCETAFIRYRIKPAKAYYQRLLLRQTDELRLDDQFR